MLPQYKLKSGTFRVSNERKKCKISRKMQISHFRQTDKRKISHFFSEWTTEKCEIFNGKVRNFQRKKMFLKNVMFIETNAALTKEDFE